MQKLMSRLNGLLSGFTGWLMLAMMLMLVADFVARLFGLPLQDMAQMSVFVMMIVIYLGFSRGEEMHDHVALEFVTDKLPRGPRRRLLQIAQVLAVLTVAILLYAVAGNALMAYRQNEAIEGAMQIPTWPTKFVMVLGLVAYLAQTILNLFRIPERGEPAGSHPNFD